MSTTDYGLAFLPDGPRKAVVCVGVFSCLVSLYGSTTLVKLILNNKKSNGMYHRLILGISCFDIFNTTGYLLSPFLLPRSTQLAWAVGNRGTCTTMGLMNQFVIGSYVYFAGLSLYYLGLVRYNLPERRLRVYLEPIVHGLAVVLPLLQSVPAALLGSLNEGPLLGLCAQYPYPYECYGGYQAENGNREVPCVRGENETVTFIGNIMVGLTVVLAVIAVLATWGVWWTVWQQHRRNQRYNPYRQGSGSGGSGGTDSSTNILHSSGPPPPTVQARRAKAVAVQALCYTLSTLNLLFWFGLGSAMEGHYLRQVSSTAELVEKLRGDTGYFVLMIFLWLGFPLQGLYNWMIYLRPRLIRWKDAHPELSWYGAYKQVLRPDKAVPQTNRTAHLARMHTRWP